MPNWAAAIIWERPSIARSVVRATREPSAAFGSTFVRRADTSANSAPTKNALPSSSTSPSHRAAWVLTGVTGAPGSSRLIEMRSTRRPSIRSTRISACSCTGSSSSSSGMTTGSGTSTRSPRDGIRPSSRTSRPATVS